MGNACGCKDDEDKTGEVKVTKSASGMLKHADVNNYYRDNRVSANPMLSEPGDGLLFESEDPHLIQVQKQAMNSNLDYTEELVFGNGAVYRGYIKNGERNGPGV